MSNDSATGGPLLPSPAPPGPAPLEGQALNRFIQGWLVGLSGLDPTLVRPAFQAEPPVIPPAATAWMAFRFTSRPADAFPYNSWDGNTSTYELQRHEELNILCSFYDLGTNGLADFYAAQARDGTVLTQNLELLVLNGMGLGVCGDMAVVPSLLKERWLYRVDLPIMLRRQITRNYPILSVESVRGEIYTDVGLPPQPLKVP